ncbi:lipopolysaccharide biosynthesis protein [Salinigranum rubrum]|uniref:Lipopolysaccharide biosynthesis protein n=1 Tax=Salinigranum rubrum TaxID=755307 RepID=A0A2I8VP89_9EURY|nr:lipopolysaccharide biosynthesis protein [Salinigranum rubrum]AUV83741.1 lipopolysaccharide biosynthesis protein [Salinigranum rubrum]
MSRKLTSLVRRLVPSGGTGQRAAKSAVWLFGQNMVDRLLPLVLLVILARLVGPLELGLVGIALVSMSALRSLTEVGLNEALIQRIEDNVDRYLNTVLAMEIARGVLIFGVLFLAAPFIGRLFDAPAAVPLIQVLAVSAVLRGLKNPAVVYFQKNLEYHKMFVYTTGGTLAFFVTGLALALWDPSAWAWVGAFLASDLVRLVASYLIHDYRPGIGFDRQAAGELIQFGKWITGTSILYFLYNEGDDVFVGWLLSPVALAYYQYAYRMSNAPATELSQVIAGVMFPAFSKFQTDVERLRESYFATVRLASFVAVPMGIGFAVVTPAFVAAAFGTDWLPMVAAMQLLALYGVYRAIGKTMGALWKAVGRPDYVTKLSLLKVALLAVLIYPVTVRWGITGTAALIVAVNLVVMAPLDLYITAKILETTSTRILSEVTYPLLASAVMAGATWYVGQALVLPAWIELCVMVVTGGVVYAAAVLALDLGTNWGMRANLRQLVSNVVS